MISRTLLGLFKAFCGDLLPHIVSTCLSVTPFDDVWHVITACVQQTSWGQVWWGLRENSPHRLLCLNAWFPVGRTIWGKTGGGVLLEKVCPQGWSWGFKCALYLGM